MSGQYFNQITGKAASINETFLLSYTGLNQIQTFDKTLTPRFKFQNLYKDAKPNNPQKAAKDNYSTLNKKTEMQPYVQTSTKTPQYEMSANTYKTDMYTTKSTYTR